MHRLRFMRSAAVLPACAALLAYIACVGCGASNTSPGRATLTRATYPNAGASASGDRATLAAEDARILQTERDETTRTSPSRLQRRAREAAAPLAAFGSVEEDPRGVVVTLDASTLFERTGDALMESGRERLDRVARALIEADAPRVVLAGFATNAGDTKRNEDLSRRRATAVAAHLASRGVPNERLSVEGRGDDRVTSNASAEGRARNDRVEVLLATRGDAAEPKR